MKPIKLFYVFGDKERQYRAYLFEAKSKKDSKTQSLYFEKPDLLSRKESFLVNDLWISDFYDYYGIFPVDKREDIESGRDVEFWLACYPDKNSPTGMDIVELTEDGNILKGKSTPFWKYLLIVFGLVAIVLSLFFILSVAMDYIPGAPF